jgi:hypothetical protein
MRTGDNWLRPYVSNQPELKIHELTPDDEFVIGEHAQQMFVHLL